MLKEHAGPFADSKEAVVVSFQTTQQLSVSLRRSPPTSSPLKPTAPFRSRLSQCLLMVALLVSLPSPVFAKLKIHDGGGGGGGDGTPPTGTVTINSGAPYTGTSTVTLSLLATDDSGVVSQMRFSSDNRTYFPPEPYATAKTWTLTPGDGSKSVYVQFSDPAGNWSPTASASITVDTTPPVGAFTKPTDGAVIGPNTP